MNFYFSKLHGLVAPPLRRRARAESAPLKRRIEAMEGEEAPSKMGACPSCLIYGSRVGAKRLAGMLAKEPGIIVALVGCDELQEGHMQVALKRLGECTYEGMDRIGFVPDLIIARCGSIGEARELLGWTVLGCRLVCMVSPTPGDHRNWGAAKGFELQAFCGADGSVVVERL